MNPSSDSSSDSKANNYTGTYPLVDLQIVRNELYKDLYATPAESLLELSVKRKLGILTKDLVEFKKLNKKPCLNFNTSLEYIPMRFRNGFDHEDTQMSTFKYEEGNGELKSEYREASPPINLERNVIVVNAADIRNVTIPNKNEPVIKKNTETCKNNLKQHHACEGKFCASDLKIASLNSLGPSYGAVFACDFCKLIVSLEENMKKHLKEHEHYSASEYFFSKNDENRQLTFLKSRSSVKNFAQISKFRVFCPQCNDNFDCDTLACSMHYNVLHSTTNEYIYSVCEIKSEKIITLEKFHSCVECKKPFKKLTDLISHLEKTKHFPEAKKNEINVFECPFDACHYKSVYFFHFKGHLMSHLTNYVTTTIDVKIKIYSEPQIYYHTAQYMDNCSMDRKEQIDAIDCLINSMKGHTDTAKIIAKLKIRKDHLYKV